MTLARALSASLVIFSACSAPSTEDLDVHGAISNAAFSVSTTAAGVPRLKGGWTLTLSLGELASSPTDVSQLNFSLVETNNAAEPVPMPLSETSPKGMHVDPGHTQAIEYNYDSAMTTGALPDPAKVKALCSGTWAVSGTMFDGARGKSTPFQGPAVAITCCGAPGQPACP